MLGMLAGSTRLDPMGQASYRALAGRPLLRLSDKHGQPILTDRVLSSYRDSLAEEVSDSAGRVFDCGETGLPLGVSAIPQGRFEELLHGVPPAAQRLHIDRTKRFDDSRLAEFVRAEVALLEDLAKAAARPHSAGADPGGAAGHGAASGADPVGADAPLGALLAAADYTWAHFPDVPDLSAPERGFIARARVAALYYAERLRRIESVL
jgi:hypothetical protein